MQIRLATVAAAILLSSGALSAAVGAPAQVDAVNVFERAAPTKAGVIAAIEKEIKTLTPIVVADRDALLKVLNDPKHTPAQIEAAFTKLSSDLKAAEPDVEKLLKQAEKVGLSEADIQKILKDVAPEIKKVFEIPGASVSISGRGVAAYAIPRSPQQATRRSPSATVSAPIALPTLTIAQIEKAILKAVKEAATELAAAEKKLLALLADPKATQAAIDAVKAAIEKELASLAPVFKKLADEAKALGLSEAEIEKILKQAPADVAKIFMQIFKDYPNIFGPGKVTVTVAGRADGVSPLASTRGLAASATVSAPIALPTLTIAQIEKAILKAVKEAAADLSAAEKKLLALLADPKATQAAIDAVKAAIEKELASLAPVFKKLADEAKSLGLSEAEIKKILKQAPADVAKIFMQIFKEFPDVFGPGKVTVSVSN
ncbi:hypothetical protein OC835_007942 [Tilletia horrida]|nr:hypothetical protein OC835_007942 [Tilletia horrida]